MFHPRARWPRLRRPTNPSTVWQGSPTLERSLTKNIKIVSCCSGTSLLRQVSVQQLRASYACHHTKSCTKLQQEEFRGQKAFLLLLRQHPAVDCKSSLHIIHVAAPFKLLLAAQKDMLSTGWLQKC